MANFVSFTTGDGAAIQVNPAHVTSVQPVPGSSPAQSYVDFAGDVRVVVVGTVNATVAALAAAGVTGVLLAAVTGASGAFISRNAAAIAAGLASVRASAGVYNLSVSAPGYPIGTALPFATASNGTARIANAQVVDATHFNVLGFNDAGAATDTDFDFALFPFN